MLADNESIESLKKEELINNIRYISKSVKQRNTRVVTKTEYNQDVEDIYRLVSDTKNKLLHVISMYHVDHYSVHENIATDLDDEELEPNCRTPFEHIKDLEEIEKTLDWHFKYTKRISRPDISTSRDNITKKKETILKAIIYYFKMANLEKLISSSTYNQDTGKEYNFYKLYRLICNYVGIHIPPPTLTENGGKSQIDNFFNKNCKNFMDIYKV